MTLLDLPHGKTQINESQKFNVTDRAENMERRGGPNERHRNRKRSSSNAIAKRSSLGGGSGLLRKRTFCALILRSENANDLCPTTSRPPALHLRFYSSVSVWRGTEGGGVDAHRNRHLNQDYLTLSNKGEGAYGCCLDLMTCSAKH